MKVVRGQERSGTQSVERAFAVLRAIADGGGGGASLREIMRLVKLNRTTTYRMLRCLVRQGAARVDAQTARYTLGSLLLELGSAERLRHKLKEALSQSLSRIAEATGDTVFLLARFGAESICIDRRLGAYPVKTLVVDVGTRRPLGVGAAGLAILQGLPDAEIARVLEQNAERFLAYGASAVKMRRRIRRARRQGYVSARVHGVDGVAAVALPILGDNGEPLAAIAVAAIAARMSKKRQQEIIGVMRVEMTRIEAMLPAVAH